MNRVFGKIPTPLEVVDLGADILNEAFTGPARVASNSLGAATQAFQNLKADIGRPREYAEIPPPPDVLIQPAFSGVGHIVEGVLGVGKGAIDGVVETIEGVRRQVDLRIKT